MLERHDNVVRNPCQASRISMRSRVTADRRNTGFIQLRARQRPRWAEAGKVYETVFLAELLSHNQESDGGLDILCGCLGICAPFDNHASLELRVPRTLGFHTRITNTAALYPTLRSVTNLLVMEVSPDPVRPAL